MKLCIALAVLISANVAFAAILPPKHHISAEEAERIAKWTPGDAGNPWQMSGQVEGDMVLTPGQKNGLINTAARWPSKTLPYVFDASVSAADRASIAAALQWYNANTCLTVVERTNQNDYVTITTAASGCWSYVGHLGGNQALNLQSNGCVHNYIILHEFLHALGFYHMQSTYNRDTYVNIFLQNVQSGMEHNFNVYSSSVVTDFGQMYDVKSVMHYDEYAFSTNGQKTITAKDGTSPLGNNVGLTATDHAKLMSMYSC